MILACHRVAAIGRAWASSLRELTYASSAVPIRSILNSIDIPSRSMVPSRQV
ncbi:MAG: hypothetical protein ACLTTU_06850 [Bilophila wadsworthia]